MNREKQALALLEKYRDWGQHRFVFWSGGKDSTVALHLALRAWGDSNSLEIVFIDTGITLPETLEYVKKLAQDWNLPLTVIKPEIDFWDYVAYAGWPHAKALWCRRLLKMEPIKTFYKTKPGWKLQVLGIRKGESKERKEAWFYQHPFMRCTKFKFTYELNPILEWSKRDIARYIHRVQISVNPAYKYFKTSGCYYCPFVRNPTHYLNLKLRHPELFQKIVDGEKVMRKGHNVWPNKSIMPLLEQQFLHEKLLGGR